MGFSGIRAVILVFVLIGLLVGMSKFGLPGWTLPAGLLVASALLKGWERRASS